MKAIQHAIETAKDHTEVFFVDEVDIDLNPCIGFTGCHRSLQVAVATPG